MEENLISFPHIMPDQSSNNLYPVNLFLQACLKLAETPENQAPNEEVISQFFDDYLKKNQAQGDYFRKENSFSGADYRFIKFIARKLIRVQLPGLNNELTFFYPFEVQILDQESHLQDKYLY